MRHPVSTPASRTALATRADVRLVFALPPALHLSVLPGRHQPCIHGCVLEIDRDYIVSVDGGTRESVFEQARRFLRVANKGHGRQAIEAVLAYRDGGRDTISISVGADVVFSTTAIPPDIGDDVRPRGRLTVVASFRDASR